MTFGFNETIALNWGYLRKRMLYIYRKSRVNLEDAG